MIRHAEKQSGDDPVLTEAGQQRAKRIANLLSTTDIQTVYSTEYHRTMATAHPLAKAKNLSVIAYLPSELDQLTERLLRDDKNAVIVGHSNTTPNLVRLLSQQDIPDMDETTYHLIYQVVTFPASDNQKPVVNVLSSQ